MKPCFSAPAAAGAGALLCALLLAGCGHPSAPATAAPQASASLMLDAGGSYVAASGADPLAAAKASRPSAAETAVLRDVQDNARSHALAAELSAHPDWLARQAALCGPADATLEARYAALSGEPPADLRQLKVACMAKDIAERVWPSSGGVTNTGVL